MAAATSVTRREAVWGNYRVIFGSLTAGNGDTYATGMKKIIAMSLDPTTNASVGATVSGGTVTFASGGSLTIWFIFVGFD